MGRASIRVRGFDENNVEQWTYVGLWSSDTTGAAEVPWGNNAATPEIEVMAPWGSPGVFVSFSA